MENPIEDVARHVAVMAVALSVGGACAPRAEDAYTRDLLACTRRAATLAESQACEQAVDARWHVDAGEDAR